MDSLSPCYEQTLSWDQQSEQTLVASHALSENAVFSTILFLLSFLLTSVDFEVPFQFRLSILNPNFKVWNISTALKESQISEHFRLPIFRSRILNLKLLYTLGNLKTMKSCVMVLSLLDNLYKKLLASVAVNSSLLGGDYECRTVAFVFPTLCHPLKNFKLMYSAFDDMNQMPSVKSSAIHEFFVVWLWNALCCLALVCLLCFLAKLPPISYCKWEVWQCWPVVLGNELRHLA